MATFVLVHGGCHGAWCWFKVAPLLEAAGHKVVTPDLPGHGTDRTPLPGLTQHDYAAAVAATLEALDEPAILIGHSMAGMTVALTAERAPERVAALVYVAAVVVSDGLSMMTEPLVAENFQNHLSAESVFGDDGQTMSLGADVARNYFYRGCSPTDIALALRLLSPEPLAAMGTPVEVTADRYGTVPRHAILTTEDVVCLPDTQRQLYERDGITDIRSLAAGHSVFLSHPDTLVEHLLSLIPESAAH